MSTCECTYSPPAKDHFDAETLAVKGEEKVSDQKCQKSRRNASLAKFSSENLAKFNVRFAVAKTTFKKKRAFYEHGSRSAGIFMSKYQSDRKSL